MSGSIEVTLTATFEYDHENHDGLDTLGAETMALDAVIEDPELLTSSFEVKQAPGAR